MRTVIGFLGVVMLGSGCGDSADDCHNTRSCPPPPDAGVTVVYLPSDAGLECNGVCVPAVADTGWSPLPFVFWQGTTKDLVRTNCPAEAPNKSQLYYATPDQTPLSCSPCFCEPSTGSCVQPTTVSVGASSVCPGDVGDAGVPFDPPGDWDGGCTTNDAIAAVDCDGDPCLATVGPVTPTNAMCAPIQPVRVPKHVTWANAAFACGGGTNLGACEDPGEICAAAPSTLPAGFSICVSIDGDDPIVMCPAGYPIPHVYYLGGDDNRGCADCQCRPPQGDSCSSLVSFYTDDACTMQVGSVTAASAGPMCVSIPEGSPLGSKQASAPVYTPGTCQPSGGGPTGSVEPKHPVTFCCRQ
jgi:hypothetical protein